MALRAKYEADFSDFYQAVEKANGALVEWESTGAAVESQMNAVGGSLSGAPVIQETEKITASLQKVPPALDSMGTSTVKTTNSIGTFRDGLNQADRTLAAFGVNIGPQVRALDELSAASGKTASQIGLVGTAGLALASGLAGWSLGRKIAEFLDLDNAIANATAKLLGFGDVAAQQAGAGTDVLDRASVIAKRVVTDFAEAQRIIVASNQAAAEGMNTGAVRVQQWGNEIARVRAKGDLPAIDADLKAHSSTLQELSQHYGISVRALEHYIQTSKDSAAAQKAWADEARPKYEALKNAQLELNNAGDGWRRTLETIAPATAKAVTEYLNMGASQTALATKFELTRFQVQALNNAHNEMIGTLARTEPAIGTLAGWMQTLDPAIRKAGESQMFFDQQLIASLGTIEATGPALEKMEGQIRSVTEAQVEQATAVSKNAPGSVGVTLGGGGGIKLNTDLQSAVGQYNQRYGLGGSSQPDFLAWALESGLATKTGGVTNNIALNGLLGTDDPQTRDLIKRLVGDAFAESMRGQRLLSSA